MSLLLKTLISLSPIVPLTINRRALCKTSFNQNQDRSPVFGRFRVLGAVRTGIAGIPVTDGGNIAQSAVSAIQNVAQTLKQIEEYRIQLKQYETQLRNSLAPAAYVGIRPTKLWPT